MYMLLESQGKRKKQAEEMFEEITDEFSKNNEKYQILNPRIAAR